MGKPADNAFAELFNGKFRTECLNAFWFLTEGVGVVTPRSQGLTSSAIVSPPGRAGQRLCETGVAAGERYCAALTLLRHRVAASHEMAKRAPLRRFDVAGDDSVEDTLVRAGDLQRARVVRTRDPFESRPGE